MCGHVGAIGKCLDAKIEDAVEDGLFVSGLRGLDSVGVGVVPFSSKVRPWVQKRIGRAPFAFRLDHAGAKAIIGHTRSATIGGVTHDTSHPFIFDNIIGAHNGTLRGPWREILEDQTNEKFLSDSQAIFYNFAYWGVKETIENIYGAWCLVWWDDDTKTLNMLRNEERPLWTARGATGNIYWASEHWMINAMLRNGEKDRDKLVRTPTADGKEERFFHKLPVNQWRQFSFNSEGEVVQHDDIPLQGAVEPVYVKKEEAGSAAHVVTRLIPEAGEPFVYATWENGQWVEHTDPQVGDLKLAVPFMSKTPNNSGPLYRTVVGVPYVSRPDGDPEIPFRDLIEFKTDGNCATCGTFVTQPQEIGYLPKDYSWMICRDCTKDWMGVSGCKTFAELTAKVDADCKDYDLPESAVSSAKLRKATEETAEKVSNVLPFWLQQAVDAFDNLDPSEKHGRLSDFDDPAAVAAAELAYAEAVKSHPEPKVTFDANPDPKKMPRREKSKKLTALVDVPQSYIDREESDDKWQDDHFPFDDGGLEDILPPALLNKITKPEHRQRVRSNEGRWDWFK